jgi:hypothetical protein
MEQLGLKWPNFHKTYLYTFFKKSVVEIQISLKYDKTNGTLHADLCTFMIIFSSLLPIVTNVPEKILKKIKAQNVISLTFYQKSCGL